jgi:HPt (histidine-containing phosphotransfer) domain-containing protein
VGPVLEAASPVVLHHRVEAFREGGDLGCLRARLEDIDGLDASSGLALLHDQLEFYVRVVGQFCANHAADMTRFEQALQARDFEGARMISHSLKGVAGMLGMGQVHALASVLDSAVKAMLDDEALYAQARTLDALIRRVVVGFERATRGPLIPR